MKVQDKKLTILRKLKQQGDPVSLSQLLDLLRDDFDFKERSVRRWLGELAQEGLIEKLGQKRGTKYRALGALPARVSSFFGLESIAVLERLRRPIYTRRPTLYNDAWFDSYKPNTNFYLPELLRKQLRESGRRSNQREAAGTYAHQIFNRLLIDLSYNSSRLEGNTYSLLDTERLILKGTGAEGKRDEEKVMILNHKEAIRYLVDNAHRLNVNADTVCTLHYLLAEGLVEGKYAGKVRDHGVRISGSTYVPPEDPQLLKFKIEHIANKASLIIDPFEQSLFLLIHISYVQAFTDVNKRTARLSSNIPLIIDNLVPLSFNNVERDDYSSAMIAIYEFQDVRPLIDLYVYSYASTCAYYDDTIKDIKFDEIRIRHRQRRRDIIRKIIEQKLTSTQINKFIRNELELRSGEFSSRVEREEFVEDVLEDLEQMDSARIAGLGITQEQLKDWLEIYRKE